MFKFEFKPRWARDMANAETGFTPSAGPVEQPVEEKDGSLFKCPITSIIRIENHPNADRLELAFCYGFQVIVQKDRYKAGDKILYVPIDSILPEWLEYKLFPPDSKIKINKHRIRQIRIRKIASQGMIVNLDDIAEKVNPQYLSLEQDVSTILGITKYEPPFAQKGLRTTNPRNKPLENNRFHKYGGIDNIKWYPTLFDGKEVIIQEKLHGSNCRASYAKAQANTLWKRVLKFFGRLPAYEYCWGSNNVQLQHRPGDRGFYGTDVYGDVLNKVDAFSKLKPGETIYGELIGPGIQKGYEYGHKEHHFVLFDVKIEKEDGSQEYLDPEQVEAYAKERGFDFVPVLYRGIFNLEFAKMLATGPSEYFPKEKVKEGCVVKIRTGYSVNGSKQALKMINEAYLDDASNTDNH